MGYKLVCFIIWILYIEVECHNSVSSNLQENISIECNFNNTNCFICNPDKVLSIGNLTIITKKLTEICNADVSINISVSKNNSIVNVKWRKSVINNMCKLFTDRFSAKLYKEGRITEGILKDIEMYSDIIKYGEGICYNYSNISIIIAVSVVILVLLMIMLVCCCTIRYCRSRSRSRSSRVI